MKTINKQKPGCFLLRADHNRPLPSKILTKEEVQAVKKPKKYLFQLKYCRPGDRY